MTKSDSEIIGIDEVGRGCLAGPLLVIAAKPFKKLPRDLRDSKKLNRHQRQKLAPLIEKCCLIGEGWASVGEINSLGLTAALRLGVKRALRNVQAASDSQILLDGHINYCQADYVNVTTIVKGDDSVPVISAASIVAKVRRDAYMADIGLAHTGYGFDKHVGYGTKAHLAAISEMGVIDGLYRLNYAPIKALII